MDTALEEKKEYLIQYVWEDEKGGKTNWRPASRIVESWTAKMAFDELKKEYKEKQGKVINIVDIHRV